jgi:hypothetical protein
MQLKNVSHMVSRKKMARRGRGLTHGLMAEAVAESLSTAAAEALLSFLRL